MKYAVFVDDNFHYGDGHEEEVRYKLGDYDSCEEAVAACRGIVDRFFEQLGEKKFSFKELWEGYMMYGEDPFIQSDDECPFSAWSYAKQRCMELCKDGAGIT